MAGGHPNLYLYCANDPVNGTDSDGTAEDPGGPKGSIRLVVTQFIMQEEVTYLQKTIGFCFAGDNRGFSPTKGSYRLQHQLIITKGVSGEPIVERRARVGMTRLLFRGMEVNSKQATASRLGSDKATPIAGGGWTLRLGLVAANPFITGSPALGHDMTLRFDKKGNLVQIQGEHSIFPACEAYVYWGSKGAKDYGVLPIRLFDPSQFVQNGPTISGLMNRTPFNSYIPPFVHSR